MKKTRVLGILFVMLFCCGCIDNTYPAPNSTVNSNDLNSVELEFNLDYIVTDTTSLGNNPLTEEALKSKINKTDITYTDGGVRLVSNDPNVSYSKSFSESEVTYSIKDITINDPDNHSYIATLVATFEFNDALEDGVEYAIEVDYGCFYSEFADVTSNTDAKTFPGPRSGATGSFKSSTFTYSVTTYTLTYDYNDGRGSYYSEDVLPNEKGTLSTSPTRDGYTFKGWFKETNTTNPFDVASEVITSNTTVYAKWEKMKRLLNQQMIMIRNLQITITSQNRRQ